MRIVFGDSAVAGFDTLHTRKSPSAVCVANISDFCFEEEACQARFAIGDGARAVVKVCRIVKAGWRATMRIDPFMYLPSSVSNILGTISCAQTQSHMSGSPKQVQLL